MVSQPAGGSKPWFHVWDIVGRTINTMEESFPEGVIDAAALSEINLNTYTDPYKRYSWIKDTVYSVVNPDGTETPLPHGKFYPKNYPNGAITFKIKWTNHNVKGPDMEETHSFLYRHLKIINSTYVPVIAYAVTASAQPAGAGTVTGAGSYAQGTQCTLTAVPAAGYSFANFTENGAVVSTSAAYTFTVTSARNITAHFTLNNYTVSASASPAAGGAVTGAGSYAHGASCSLTAQAAAGYAFMQWSEGGAPVSYNAGYTFTVSGARSLTAQFAKIDLAVTQPTATQLTGSIAVSPAAGFTYSINGTDYQASNLFTGLAVGAYAVTVKNSGGVVSAPVFAVISASGIVSAQNYRLKITHAACPGSNDGSIEAALEKALPYTITIQGGGYAKTDKISGTAYTAAGLPPGAYTVCFGIEGVPGYNQCFNAVITEPKPLSAYSVKREGLRAVYALSGAEKYYVTVNGVTTQTAESAVSISLHPGNNVIKIATDKICQGVFEEKIAVDGNSQITLYPNPTTGKVIIKSGGFGSGGFGSGDFQSPIAGSGDFQSPKTGSGDFQSPKTAGNPIGDWEIAGPDSPSPKPKTITLQITSITGAVLATQSLPIQPDGTVRADLSAYADGVYLIKIGQYVTRVIVKK